MLCLGFLMMIGFSLTAEGLGFHIPKGYLYAAIGFSLLIEAANQLVRWRRKRHLQGNRDLRESTAHAVLRLLGERLGFKAKPGEDYQTLAGLAMSLLDRLPVTGDSLEFAGWQLQVIEVKERRVNRLFLKPLR